MENRIGTCITPYTDEWNQMMGDLVDVIEAEHGPVAVGDFLDEINHRLIDCADSDTWDRVLDESWMFLPAGTSLRHRNEVGGWWLEIDIDEPCIVCGNVYGLRTENNGEPVVRCDECDTNIPYEQWAEHGWPSYEEIEQRFRDEVIPTILRTEFNQARDARDSYVRKDLPLRMETWNNWVDELARDGEIAEIQMENWEAPQWLA